MTTEKKVLISIGLATILILVGGIWLLTALGAKEQAKLSKPLVGEAIADQGRNHVPDGTKVDYNSNPPTSGPHYARPQPGGIYDKPVLDGNLIHSMEHGAVILWYKPDLAKDVIEKIKQIFYSVNASKKIMVPRDSLDTQIALTSWGRLLKPEASNEAKIKDFMETNNDRGPEKAPL